MTQKALVASSRRRELKLPSALLVSQESTVASSRRRELKLPSALLVSQESKSPPHGGVS